MPKVVEGSWGRFEEYEEKKRESEEINQVEINLVESLEFQGQYQPVPQSVLKIAEIEEDEELIDHTPYTTLQYLQASLFGTIIEDTITQLRILVQCNNELRIIKVKSDWNYLLKEKYGVKQDPVLDELSNIDPHNLACNEYKIEKLDYDRQYVTDVISATYVDLSLNKSFKALQDYVNNEVAKFDYRVALVEEEANNNIIRKEVNKQLRLQRNHIKTVTYDVNVKIDAWKVIVEDSVLDAQCKSRYIGNWQQARTEQHLQSINDREAVFISEIEYYKQRSDNEQRVHSEVELLINIEINEVLQKIEDWMTKYDTDMENLDLKIQIKKNNYQNMLEKRTDLEETLADHEKIMREWIHFKEEREKLRIYRERMNACATSVQSWWRGLLVRRQLGPFKPKGKGKGKPKKK